MPTEAEHMENEFHKEIKKKILLYPLSEEIHFTLLKNIEKTQKDMECLFFRRKHSVHLIMLYSIKF
jgi:hypothetical protein